MLFSSPEFIFLFLPFVVCGFHLFRSSGRETEALFFLLLASLFFYGWWSPVYLLLLCASIIANFAVGRAVVVSRHVPQLQIMTVGLGVAGNLLVLAYYKYAAFFLNVYLQLKHENPFITDVFLPLGISFFTFTQISYLVDLKFGKTQPGNLLSYALFVTFFPHLIAGPIVHHRELAMQFGPAARQPVDTLSLSAGITLFAGGLFKKAAVADTLSLYVQPAFAEAATRKLDLVSAWAGALSYTFQLYFDFSGYSDMALGLALLFGIRLPVNFHSPYRAVSIIDFWRRWHITLSNFLRDYLYIPLGGSRHGRARQYAALMITMGFGGLWHGAGWTFVIWGLGHGLLLLLNHTWRSIAGAARIPSNAIPVVVSWAVTFFCVVCLWVVFRAPDMETALRFLSAMFDTSNVILPKSTERFLAAVVPVGWGWRFDLEAVRLYTFGQVIMLAGCLAAVVLLPNFYQLLARFNPALDVSRVEARPKMLVWSPSFRWAFLFASMLAYGAVLSLVSTSEFLYFRF